MTQQAAVIVIGAGIAGMATAARLQARGIPTHILEAHTKIGGCAGYFRRRGFSFDVGATTLVDFEAGGVGGELLDAIHMPLLDGEALPGYVAWLPDRVVTLHRDKTAWERERRAQLGDTLAHRRFWALLDHVAAVFWGASRRGIVFPMRHPRDVWGNLRALGVEQLPLAHLLAWTMGDALRFYGLRGDAPLVSLLSMLIEDTVHSTVDRAPLINAALGITIRAAGLTRHRGGMRGFWEAFAAHYRALGGSIRLGQRVTKIEGERGAFIVHATGLDGRETAYPAAQVVSTLPIDAAAKLLPERARARVGRYVKRDEKARGGAIVVFLGVPSDEIQDQAFTHHQLLQDYRAPLGNGNNMFVSVSAPDDTESAPPGYRAVMISTHCDLSDWEGLSDADYEIRKRAMGDCLIGYARRVYPRLGERAAVYEVGTPRTYAHFTARPRGAVGGARQTRWNSNQFAVPHESAVQGLWLAGDTTFPGLGTVACVLGSRIVADGVVRMR